MTSYPCFFSRAAATARAEESLRQNEIADPHQHIGDLSRSLGRGDLHFRHVFFVLAVLSQSEIAGVAEHLFQLHLHLRQRQRFTHGCPPGQQSTPARRMAKSHHAVLSDSTTLVQKEQLPPEHPTTTSATRITRSLLSSRELVHEFGKAEDAEVAENSGRQGIHAHPEKTNL